MTSWLDCALAVRGNRKLSVAEMMSNVAQEAVACGVRPVRMANMPHILSVSSAGPDMAECQPSQEGTDDHIGVLPGDTYRCSRCPRLAANTAYTVHLVATEVPQLFSGSMSNVQTLQLTTLPVPATPRFSEAPVMSSSNSSSITINFATHDAVAVAYAVTYAETYAPFFPGYELQFQSAGLRAEAIIRHARQASGGTLETPITDSSQNSTSKKLLQAATFAPDTAPATLIGEQDGAVVAAGFAAAASAVQELTIAPKCTGGACEVSENVIGAMLAPDTAYRVWMVAVGEASLRVVNSSSTVQSAGMRTCHVLTTVHVQPLLSQTCSLPERYRSVTMCSLAASQDVFMVTAATQPDRAPPAPTGNFPAVTESSFSFSLQQDEPGIAQVALVLPREQVELAATISPGATDAPLTVPHLLRSRKGAWRMHGGQTACDVPSAQALAPAAWPAAILAHSSGCLKQAHGRSIDLLCRH
jgi:hypothetical protein